MTCPNSPLKKQTKKIGLEYKEVMVYIIIVILDHI